VQEVPRCVCHNHKHVEQAKGRGDHHSKASFGNMDIISVYCLS
jgi:hypothetical protein